MTLIWDHVYWLLCWLAFRLYLVLPIDWRISWAILPHAGWYAHQHDFAAFRERRDELRNVAREVAA